MNSAYVDSNATDEVRRRRLFEGQIFVFSPRESTLALTNHARQMIEEAFGGIDPLRAQYEMPVERYVEICTPLKPAFIHNDTTKELIRNVLTELGCDLERTYQDVPRLRMVTSHGYLTSGVGYAHHPHRDTWYSAPFCQQNWWLPIYDFGPGNGLAFHPRYWREPLRNGSRDYNYYRWNAASRGAAAQQVKTDTRPQPKAEEPVELEPDLRPIIAAGGIILFSAAQLHSTVANTTARVRWSIDFRVVDGEDARRRRGARNIDSESTGTTMRDYLRVSDLARLPDEVVALYDDGVPVDGVALWPAR